MLTMKRLGPWHSWFAWHPAWTLRGWKWLRWVERCRACFPYVDHPSAMGFWIYRA